MIKLTFPVFLSVRKTRCYAMTVTPNVAEAHVHMRAAPWGRALLPPQRVEVEQGRRQADGQVGGSHLVLSHASCHVAQQTQERLHGLAVLVGQQQHGSACSLQPQLLRHVCRAGGRLQGLIFRSEKEIQ